MATGTTMADLKANLYDALKERPALAGVQLSYGIPKDARRELIWLGDTQPNGIQEIPSMKAGTKRRHEDYRLDVYVQVIGGKPQHSEKRACQLSAEIEDCLANDTTVGGTPNLVWAVVSAMEMSTGETTDGARTVLRIEITAKGNLL
jgi:hypothetical protein